MSRAIHVTADPGTVSMATSIRPTAQAAPLLILTTRTLGELPAELGSMDAAATYLLELAEDIGHPIAVNLPITDSASKTAFTAPRTWTDERLQGWIGGHGAEFEAEFGEVSHVGAAFPAAGGQR